MTKSTPEFPHVFLEDGVAEGTWGYFQKQFPPNDNDAALSACLSRMPEYLFVHEKMVKCHGRGKRVKKVAPADHTREAKSVCGCGQSTSDVELLARTQHPEDPASFKGKSPYEDFIQVPEAI